MRRLLPFLLCTLAAAQVQTINNTTGASFRGLVNSNFAWLNTNKAPLSHVHLISDITGLQTALDAKAPIANPTFTGTIALGAALLRGGGTSLPATCAVGDLYFLTTGTTGLYQCTSTNTWTLPGGAAGNAPYAVSSLSVISGVLATITHNLGTKNVAVSLIDHTTGASVAVAWTAATTNTVTFTPGVTETLDGVVTTGGIGQQGPQGTQGNPGSNGAMPDPGGNGFMVRTALNTDVARSLVAGTGISITNADGTGGNPTITATGSGTGTAHSIYYQKVQSNLTGNGTLWTTTIPGGTIGAGQCMFIVWSVKSVTKSSGQHFSVTWGSEAAIDVITQGSNGTTAYLQAELCNDPGVTNSQQWNWQPGSFVGNGNPTINQFGGVNAAAQDSTASKTLSLTSTLGNGSDVNQLLFAHVTGPW